MEIRTTGQLCPSWNVVDIECKFWGNDVDGKPILKDHTESGDSFIKCKSSFGLVCYNNNQPSGLCKDYAVRFRCGCQSTTIQGTTSTTKAPEVMCPEGKTWIPCAFKCNQVGFFFFRNSGINEWIDLFRCAIISNGRWITMDTANRAATALQVACRRNWRMHPPGSAALPDSTGAMK